MGKTDKSQQPPKGGSSDSKKKQPQQSHQHDHSSSLQSQPKDEEPLRAVLIASEFDTKLDSVSTMARKSISLVPLANVPLIIYQIEALFRGGVVECVVVVKSEEKEEIKEVLEKLVLVDNGGSSEDEDGQHHQSQRQQRQQQQTAAKRSSSKNLSSAGMDSQRMGSASSISDVMHIHGMRIVFFDGPNWLSEGAALRDLEGRDDLRPRHDFVLVSAGSIFNIDILRLVQEHKERRRSDKNWLLTSVFRLGVQNRDLKPLILVRDQYSHQLIKYSDTVRPEFSMEVVSTFASDRNRFSVLSNVSDCGLAVCGTEIMLEFRENFDFDTMRDYIKGKLDSGDAEILGNRIFAHITESFRFEFAARINDFFSYAILERDVIRRWLHPLVPELELVPGEKHEVQRMNVYKERSARAARSSEIMADTVLGRKSRIGEHSKVAASSIGKNVQVLDKVSINSSHIWESCTIEKSVSIDHAIVCDGVHILEGCVIHRGSVIGTGLTIGPNVTIPPGSFVTCHQGLLGDLVNHEEDEAEIEKAMQENRFLKPIGSSAKDKMDSLCACIIPADHVKDPFALAYLAKKAPPKTVNALMDLLFDEDDRHPKDHSEDGGGKFDEFQVDDSLDEGNESGQIDTGEESSDEDIRQKMTKPSRGQTKANVTASPVLNTADKNFSDEAVETVRRAIIENHDVENAVLELNSLKLVFDKSFVDCSRELFRAILLTAMERLTAKKHPDFLSAFVQILTRWTLLIRKFAPPSRKPEQVAILASLEKFMEDKEKLHGLLPSILQNLYDDDCVEEDVMIEWYRKVKSAKIKTAAEPFISWLEEAEEEDED